MRNLAILLVLCMFSLSGCSFFSATGKLILQISDGSSLQTVTPNLDLTVSRYEIRGKSEDGKIFEPCVTDNATFLIEDLEHGTWRFQVYAINKAGVSIGYGEKEIVISKNKTETAEIITELIEGTGTLNVTVEMQSINLHNPKVLVSMVHSSGELSETEYNVQNYTLSIQEQLESGLHLLTLKVYDGDVLQYGVVEQIMVVEKQTANAAYTFSDKDPIGSIRINLNTEMKEPIEVKMTGIRPYILEGGKLQVKAITPGDEKNIIFIWYLKGSPIETGSRVMLNNIPGGNYRLDVIAVTPDGSRGGSATDSFTVIDLEHSKNVTYKYEANWKTEQLCVAGVAVDQSELIYLVDNTGKIFIYDIEGTLIESWTIDLEDRLPKSIAVDTNANVYLALDTDQVVEVNSTGITAYWGQHGEGEKEFNKLEGIAVDCSGNVYVADSGNNRIQKFSPHGDFITQWGKYGSEVGDFNNTADLAIDYEGNVYVLDSGNHRVQKFDSVGNYIMYWGEYGTESGQFDSPQGIAVDLLGNIFITDTNNRRIQKFDAAGTFLTEWDSYEETESFQQLGNVVTDIWCNVYITDYKKIGVSKFSPLLEEFISGGI